MNYGDLKTHFDALLNRSDITTALTEQFINDGIARIQRSLRTPMQEKVQTTSITTPTTSLTLPADFLETISLYFDQYELQRVSMKRFRELNQSNHTGSPMFYTREGADLLLYPQPATGDLVLYYYAAMPALVNATDENAMTLVASIPAVVAEKWLKEGFNILDPNVNGKEIVRRLKAENLDGFLATDKEI